MKAITLPQPWASLMAIGAKTVETRPYATAYRGPIAIHAAIISAPVNDPYYKNLLESTGLVNDQLPHGAILATGRLIDCEKITNTNCPCYPEYAFGDFIPGWFAWKIVVSHPLQTPIPAKGHRGLWECAKLD